MATANKTWNFTGSAESWSPTTTSGAPTLSYSSNRLQYASETGRNKTGEGYFSITGTFATIFGISTSDTVTGYSLGAYNGGTSAYTLMDACRHGTSGAGASLTINDGTTRTLVAGQTDYTATSQTRTPSGDPGISGLSLAGSTSITLYTYFYSDNQNDSGAGATMYIDDISVTIVYSSAPTPKYFSFVGTVAGNAAASTAEQSVSFID